MKNRILLYKRGSRYEVARVFIDDLAKGFQTLGHEAIIVDGVSPEVLQQVQELQRTSIDFIFSFNGVSFELIPYFDSLMVAAFIDHPIAMVDRFEVSPHRAILTSVDPAHLSLLEERRKEQKWACHFLPHGGSELEEPFSNEERKIDVLFAGSYTDPELLRLDWPELSDELLELAQQIIEHGLKRKGVSLTTVWEEILQMRDDLNVLIKVMAEVQLLPLIEMYLRNALRKECFALLAQAGIRVHLYGIGWEQHPNAAQHHLCGQIGYRDLIRVMRKAKIVLNINPVFTKSSHERPLTAMLQKAVVITDCNPFYTEHFRDGKHLYTYELQQMESLPEIIASLLRDPRKIIEVGEAGYLQSIQKHTWKSRAESILKMVHAYQTS